MHDLDDAWATAERPRFVAGSIGPSNRTLSLSPNVNDPAFRERFQAWLGGVWAEKDARLDRLLA